MISSDTVLFRNLAYNEVNHDAEKKKKLFGLNRNIDIKR